VPGAVARLAPRFVGAPRFGGEVLGLALGLGLGLWALGEVASLLLVRLYPNPDGMLPFALAFLNVPMMALIFGYHGLLYARGRLGLLSGALALQTLVKMVAVVAAVLAGGGLVAMIGTHLLGTLAALALLLFGLPVLVRRPQRAFVRLLALAALPLGFYALVYQALPHLGLWWLGAAAGELRAASGFYAAALNVARVLTLVPAVLATVLFARLAEAAARGERRVVQGELRTAVRLALMLLLPAAAALVAEARPITALLYGAGYREAAAMLAWLGPAVALLGLLDLLLRALLACGHNRLALAALALGGALALAALKPLIALAGGVGAAMALALGAAAAVAASGVAVRLRLGPFLAGKTLARLALATLLLALTLLLWHGEGAALILVYAAAGGGYFLLLFLIGELKPAELRELVGVGPSARPARP